MYLSDVMCISVHGIQVARTCARELQLAECDSKETLRQKLDIAMANMEFSMQ